MPNSGNVAIGKPTRGGDITFQPGLGMRGAPGGDIIWRAADGKEVLRLSEQGVSLFEQLIPLEKVLELLAKLKEPRRCSCPVQQILTAGCSCGGT